jgi:hypothetical protein
MGFSSSLATKPLSFTCHQDFFASPVCPGLSPFLDLRQPDGEKNAQIGISH